MKLNHDCVREVLLFIEENTGYSESCTIEAFKINYAPLEIVYTLDKLYEAGYIKASKDEFVCDALPEFEVHALTYNGHIFLDNIRDEHVWKKTNTILSKFTSTSLNIVNTVASQVITSLVQSQIGL